MFCAQCGAPNDDTAKFCQKCGSAIAGTAQAAVSGGDPRMRGASADVRVAAPPAATGKNPTVATILSVLIAGAGQFYNGDMKKGAVMLGGAILLGAGTAGLGWLAIAIWSAVDAYRVASGTAHRW